MENNLIPDPTDKIGHRSSGYVIHFVHAATMATCHFKAFLTSWDDNFKQDWASYETVGRMDPIRTYKRTSRIISFGLEIPSFDPHESAHNLKEVQTLIQMSYPTFNQYSTLGKEIASSAEAQTEATKQNEQAQLLKLTDEQRKTKLSLAGTVSHMVSPPFLRIKFANWINDPTLDTNMTNNDAYGPDDNIADEEIEEKKKKNERLNLGSGLFGTIENVKFSPDLNEGVYGPSVFYKKMPEYSSEQILLPKLLKLDIVFNVLHTNDLGYYANTGQPRSPSYPYNANVISRNIKVK